MLLLYAIPRKSQALHRKFTSLPSVAAPALLRPVGPSAVRRKWPGLPRAPPLGELAGASPTERARTLPNSSYTAKKHRRTAQVSPGRAAAFHFFQSCVSFRMPNSLRSKPLRHLGLLRTTTCIEPTTFRRLIRHYRRSAPGMFRFSSGAARPAPSPPPPARPSGWRW